MKFLFRAILILVLILTTQVKSDAQIYKTAAGLRLGYPVSASIKHFISDNTALEAYVGFRSFAFYSQFNINAAYLKHNDIDGVDGLQWYYGFGAGVGFYSYDFDSGFGSTSLSISGYLGLEYTFDGAPISLTLDWVPTYFFADLDFGAFGADYGALGVRYIISE